MFRHTFRSLAVRNFRLFVIGQVFSVTGTWMMLVAQDWLVLSLSGDSATQLGIVTGLQFAPVLLLTLHGGTLADRWDRRRLLAVANGIAALLAALVFLVAVGPGLRLWHLYVFATALGMVTAVEAPTRMALVGELVGAELLPNASALSGAYFNVARMVGPALAGLLIGRLGAASVFLLNAVSYGATVASVALMREHERCSVHPRSDRHRRSSGVTAGLRHVLGRSDLLLPLALLAVVGSFGFNFQLTLPVLAKAEFGTGPASFGLLTSALAAGSLGAALVTTARVRRPTAGVVIGASALFGLCETASGLAPTFALTLVALAATGFGAGYFAQATNHRVQLGSDPRYRGRVLALYVVIFQGSTPLGALPLGPLVEAEGARSGLLAGGLVTLAASAAALVWARRSDPPEYRLTGAAGEELNTLHGRHPGHVRRPVLRGTERAGGAAGRRGRGGFRGRPRGR
ncbi:MFS transporter [Streptomyces sp. NRRL B-24085]|uniref:MFS transporter n=1 Tax=Streptomyces sp. NRRL B-24085 TaxID=1709476 RepID=UPI000A400D39|nr:MFS transporter [Streptomyces sp. NRRL B-24085]